MKSKETALTDILRGCGKAAIALSGGLDSTVLLHFAISTLGAQNCAALTVDTPQMPRSEIEAAAEFCAKMNVPLRIVRREKIAEPIRNNPTDRCYLCKRAIFSEFAKICVENDLGVLCDGANADDLSDYRPGMRATAEFGVRSPLLQADWGKLEIRSYAVKCGLQVANLPSNACLMTRFETGIVVDEKSLVAVEKAESYVKSFGFSKVRVRVHAKFVRIEIAPEELVEFYAKAPTIAQQISLYFKELGFARTSIDLDGYAMGNMNK